MAIKRKPKPRAIIIAGPNGAGKTTFAREFLPNEGGVMNFINADLIATGLSPLKPELAARAAGRLMLEELDRLFAARADFAFETTLSGKTYLEKIATWKQAGYIIEIVFLKLVSHRTAVDRVALRVAQGGHDVPVADIKRRFARGLPNFFDHYRELADSWALYDSSGDAPVLVGTIVMKKKRVQRPSAFAKGVGAALKRAAKQARKTARMYGTPIVVNVNGKSIRRKP